MNTAGKQRPWTGITSMENTATNYNRVQSQITMLLGISDIEWGLTWMLFSSFWVSRTLIIDSYPQFVYINELLECVRLKIWFLAGCTFIWQWEENSIVTVCNRHMSSSCRRICWTHGFVSLKFCKRIVSFEHFQISHNSKQLESANICLHGNLLLLDTFSLASFCCS